MTDQPQPDWRAIADSLAIEDPWAHSYEGLTDYCIFCDSDDEQYHSGLKNYRYDVNGHPTGSTEGHTEYTHKPDCAWMTARTLLGYNDPHHHTRDA